MPNAKASKKSAAKAAPKKSAKASSKLATKVATKSAAKAPKARMSLEETMKMLEGAGSEQTRKTYARHGAKEPMFGVSFAFMKTLVKKIGVDHELAVGLWGTGNHDARTLAMKIADPEKMSPADLDRWAKENMPRMCGGYVAMIAAEGPHGAAVAERWAKSDDPRLRAMSWPLLGQLSMLDETIPDDVFIERLELIAKTIHTASNAEREAMNMAVITIGGRNSALKKAAIAAAKRIGKVEVDHGDTDCKTPDAIPYIEKMWAHAAEKKFDSPAAQERSREPMRTRC